MRDSPGSKVENSLDLGKALKALRSLALSRDESSVRIWGSPAHRFGRPILPQLSISMRSDCSVEGHNLTIPGLGECGADLEESYRLLFPYCLALPAGVCR
ncbi:hypothetical protein Nepgr_032235 [Nepenthes gracilis]|uniref:Uncharacterized protein n=1 Tax=Nepenthes gracilis TaxID=150966 RepID=A0AAD3TKG2_NEPGR|nr:hypothetical protein Nepgr_032235 [Nepenthes gracilis]